MFWKNKTKPSNSIVADGVDCAVLVLDVSNSTAIADWKPNRLAGVQAAAIEFVRSKARVDPAYQAAVAAFNTQARLLHDFVAVGEGEASLVKVIDGLRSRGGTDQGEALRLCLSLFPLEALRGRRQVLLVTDGDGGDPRPAAGELKRRGVRVECVGVGGEPEAVNEALLRETASVEQGRVLYRFIGDRRALVEHFGAIARSQG